MARFDGRAGRSGEWSFCPQPLRECIAELGMTAAIPGAFQPEGGGGA